MKELEIYKQEIFHRSEEKIKKRRRNRRRMMLCGIPLCLCAVIGTVVLLQSGDNVESEKAAQDMLQESIMESTTTPFQSVQIRDWTGKTRIVEERAKVSRLHQAITQRYAAADAYRAEDKVEDYSFSADRDGAMQLFAESVPGYEIEFMTDSGETRNFILWLDGWLCEYTDRNGNRKTTKRVFLSPEQVAQLEALLTEG